MTLVIPATFSVLVSVWMETLVYGMNVIMFFLAVSILLRKHNKVFANRPMLVAIIILFALATAHVAVNLKRLIVGYVLPNTKAQMEAYLINIADPLNVTKTFLVIGMNLVSDSIIIFRLYIVYEKRIYVCIAPIILLLSSLSCGLVSATYIALVKPGDTIFLAKIASWGTPLFSTTLATNLLCTLLIAGRIYFCTRDLGDFFPSVKRQYSRVISIVVESAAISAFAQTIELSFYSAQFPGVYFVADTTAQINTFVPMLIVVVVGLHSPQDGTSYTLDLTHTSPDLEFVRVSPADIRSKSTNPSDQTIENQFTNSIPPDTEKQSIEHNEISPQFVAL